MRKAKLISVFTAASILLCSCAKKEDTGETDIPAETSEAEELIGEPLTESLLEGLWVGEEGFVCRFDFEESIFTDRYGASYDIIEIGDDSVTISPESGLVNSSDMAYALPAGSSLTVNAVYYEGELHILDTVAYNTESDEGQEIAQSIRDRLEGNTFNLSVMGGYLEINDDLTEVTAGSIYGEGYTIPVTFTGASISYDFDGEGEMIFWLIEDEVVICMDGQIGFATESELDYHHRWLYYDAAFETVEILDYTGKSNQFFSEDPITGERTPLDERMPQLISSAYLAELESDRGEFVQYPGQPGVFICNEVFEQYTDETFDSTIYLIDMRSPYADMMLRRNEVINGDPGEISDYTVDFSEGYISIATYENEWPYDYVHLTSEDDLYLLEYVDSWTAIPYSDYYYISLDDDCGEAVINFEYDGNLAEGSYIYCINENTLIDPVQLDTTYENGIASAVIGGPGYYFLGQIEETVPVTEENYFDMDPEDSQWARTSDTGDIIGLVDMEYIEESYNGVFVVDSVEDLASLTYFINTYPRDGYDVAFCVWVDLVDDIDLTGYEWAPLGLDVYSGVTAPFSGIFAGNGHTISGLNIRNRYLDNGFFGTVYFATVIGLNIEDAVINGTNSNLMAGHTSNTQFYDCHVSGELINSFGEAENLFPYSPDYGNNEYYDCSISVINSNDQWYDLELPNSTPDPSTRNELQELFDPEQDGTYDYSTDYFFG